MVTCVPLNASHFSQILSIGTQVFREDDVSVLGDALHTACAPSSVVLAPDGSVAAFAVFCQGAPLSTRISSYHIQYAPLFVQIGEMVGPFYELAFLAVHPTHQGARLGATLLTRCLEDLKKSADAAACWLVVDAGNAGAQRLYERNGFQPLGTLCGTPLPSCSGLRKKLKCGLANGWRLFSRLIQSQAMPDRKLLCMPFGNPKAKIMACLLANCGILAITLALVTLFADQSPFWRFGYSPDLVVVSVRIDTLGRYITLLSVIAFINAGRIIVEEVGMPILGFTIYNPDKKHVEGFSKNELQFFANAMYIVSGLRNIFMMVVSISQIDLAIWSLLVGEFTSLFTIRMLLNEKTFGPKSYTAISQSDEPIAVAVSGEPDKIETERVCIVTQEKAIFPPVSH